MDALFNVHNAIVVRCAFHVIRPLMLVYLSIFLESSHYVPFNSWSYVFDKYHG